MGERLNSLLPKDIEASPQMQTLKLPKLKKKKNTIPKLKKQKV